MVRNGYGTKMIFTMVRNGRYEMIMEINVIPKYMLHVGTVKSMYLRRGKKRKKKNIHVYYVIVYYHIF
jgi:hypothetical protein